MKYISGHAVEHCPRCGRPVRVSANRFHEHSVTASARERCRMSGQHTPIRGVSEVDFIARAHVVADFAEQVRDADPTIVWDALTCLPGVEVQRLLMLALAAIQTEDRTVYDLFDWVCDLPVAKVSA